MQKSFATLIQVAQTRSDGAAVKLGKLMAREAESDQKHRVLVNYRDEYRARLDAATRRGAPAPMPTADMRNFRAFLHKLDEAVRQQESELAFWREQIAQARSNWRDEERSRQSFSTIGARRDAGLAMVHARRDQKQHDEFSSRTAISGTRLAFSD